MAEAQNRRTTSFAKEVHLDTYKQNKLDQLKSLRETYSRTQEKGHEKEQSRPMERQAALGPKNEPGMHLRPPDSANRRAVDAQVHKEQLAKGRTAAQERAANLLKDFEARRSPQNRTQANGRSR